MIHKIRTSKVTKVIASYLAIQMIVQIAQPAQLWALTSGPSQPEFNSFTPIGTSDMVNLSSGDFNYNIPVMDVGGYPLNLSYDSGITMDQEASWVGLGWNLNVGQINRQVRGIPDDFKGDEMTYESHMKPNVTVGVDAMVDLQLFGWETVDGVGYPGIFGGSADSNVEVNASVGVSLKHNNYTGISYTPSFGIAFDLANTVSVGVDTQLSATEGVTVSPNISALLSSLGLQMGPVTGSLNAGIAYNSNRGLSNFNLNTSLSLKTADANKARALSMIQGFTGIGSGAGSISFNNITMTPRKRTAFINNNGTVSVSLGGTIFGSNVDGEISGMGSVQKVKDPSKKEKAYGYEFTGYATPDDILDYNRENDNAISKTTLALPVSNYTYDLYSVQGQGAAGMFRPFRSQIGHINDDFVEDETASFTFGAEIAPGAGFHFGANFIQAPSESSTGLWDSNTLQYFKQNKENVREAEDALDYEPVYFKYIGEPRVDRDQGMFDALGGYSPIALEITGPKKSFNKEVGNNFRVKKYKADGTNEHSALQPFTTKFKRNRDIRNQTVQKITAEELENFYEDERYVQSRLNKSAKSHHTAEIRVLNGDGSTYVFGETAYNTLKKEVTFTTDSGNFNCASGLVSYGSSENSTANRSGIDNFYDAVSTPAYAHTYLLSSVFSSDYEDLGGDGPTDDDLGSYTNFIYKTMDENYKWRVPYERDMASYNAGLNSDQADQKGSYIYGEKEIKYIDKIVTKTHVAIFDLSPRKDGRGVIDENGGRPSTGQEMFKINKIHLYSKPEAVAAKILDDNPDNDLPISAIKTAHFYYDYSLCKNVQNNGNESATDNEYSNEGGKLTLKKVYFTYRNFQMGKYTPYEFNYDSFNPNYNLKSYDVWGNYKPVVESALAHDVNGNIIFDTNAQGIQIPRVAENYEGGSNGYCGTQDEITAPEFAFVQQDSKELQDAYASAWSLTSIDLPSGGRIELTYETDDYQYVQDKATMQMFKVVGVGEGASSANPEGNQKFYKSGSFNVFDGDADYLYVKLPEETSIDNETFERKYLNGIRNKPIYFRFLMNMTKSGAESTSSRNYDYVTGYFNIPDNKEPKVFTTSDGGVYAAIPMKFTDMEGGVAGTKQVNPISKAGWYFGRRYLNGIVFGLNQDFRTENLQTIAKKVISSFASAKDILTGPNGKLRSNQFLNSQRFIPEKSWIRLTAPKANKLGGGVRIKKLLMKDQWGKMVDPTIPVTDRKYNKEYGQEYSYTLEDGTTSGVATFEPNMSKENPFVEPFYNNSERLIAPREVNYVEKPFGSSFFPSASVTYSRVEVKNLQRENIKTHATGRVITEYFTSRDYPTIVDHTDIDSPDNFATNEDNFLENLLGGLIGAEIRVNNEYALSQGFVIHTNDMNGKMRSQKVYGEGQDEPLSFVEYKYSTSATDESILDNKVPVVFKDGTIASSNQLGVDYDVVTDFRESYNLSKTEGVSANVVSLPFVPPVTVGTIMPSSSRIENVAHTVITTKVIHTTAILKEKIAMDLGSKVSTINEAWDAETGQVILTRTINEFDDEYYNFNFPAYWSYKDMGQASKNIGITGVLKNEGEYFTIPNADEYFTLGDELMISYRAVNERYWIVGFNESGNGVLLMARQGGVVNRSEGLAITEDVKFKVIRSGYRNQQMANMGAITLMKNPIQDNTGVYLTSLNPNSFDLDVSTATSDNLRIVNASAVEYSDFWNCQCESQLPFIGVDVNNPQVIEDLTEANYPIDPIAFNPYVYNVKGEWRAEKSYAYLTERSNVNEGVSTRANTRREGYFKEFTPYYALIDGEWKKGSEINDKWTFASEVTQYSPYGAEIENRDALNRYSSAQYGYNYTLPTAVSSNSKYRDMGMDSFEDYSYDSTLEGHFNFRESADIDGDQGIQVTEIAAHSGRNSLLVPANKKAELVRDLLGEEEPNNNYDGDNFDNTEDRCPYTPSQSNADYDGDGVGDACDDDAVPRIVGRYTSNEVLYINGVKECVGRSAEFTIHGKPNDKIEYGIVFTKTNYRQMSLNINDVKIFGDADVRDKQGEVFRFNDITLDITGKYYIDLDFDVVRGQNEDRPNVWEMEFIIFNKGTEEAVEGGSFILKSDGRRTRSCGSPEWSNINDLKH